jgi:hypothetical protein
MARDPKIEDTKTKSELVSAHKSAILRQINDRRTFLDFEEYVKHKRGVMMSIEDPYNEYMLS